MKIETLHYITQSLDGKSHSQMAEEACQYGVKWVQLRIKNAGENLVLEEALKTKLVCEKYGAKLIINDYVPIARQVQADGVHLGKTDTSPSEARNILGTDFIIGGTANTFDDIQNLNLQGVDYIGLGPFRFTSTKDNLSPILGIKGYQTIIQQLKKQNINIPIIAIGGIQTEDIRSILNTGVHGIALASLINASENKREVIEKILNELRYGEITHSR